MLVRLSGHYASWRFPGSPEFAVWAKSKPWKRERCVVVQAASETAWSRMRESFERSLSMSDWPECRVQVRQGILSENDTFGAAACRALDAGDRCEKWSRMQLVRFAAESTAVSPTVFSAVFNPSVWSGSCSVRETIARRLEEASQFTDAVHKVDQPGALGSVLIVQSPSEISLPENCIDLRFGMPDVNETALLGPDRRTAWNAYVHLRIAWDVGGDLEIAEELEELVAARCPVEDDTKLEAALCEFARGMANRWNGEYKTLNAKLGQADAAFFDRLPLGRLTRLTVGQSRMEVCPWVARAILAECITHPAGLYLRYRLRCQPLANFILARCGDFEARLRATQAPVRESLDAFGDEACHLLESFNRCAHDPVRLHYPAPHPSPPSFASEFATLGAWLRAQPPRPQSNYDLKDLRNAMAHGHYCSWHTVSTLRRLHAQFG